MCLENPLFFKARATRQLAAMLAGATSLGRRRRSMAARSFRNRNSVEAVGLDEPKAPPAQLASSSTGSSTSYPLVASSSSDSTTTVLVVVLVLGY